MPEGHTIHALAQRIDAAFAGHPVAASSPQGRFAESAALLDGAVLEQAEAWGKHLFVDFAGGRAGLATVHIHLGLFGRCSVTTRRGRSEPLVKGAVRLRLLTPTRVGDLRGPTACEILAPDQVSALLGRLGPDPLRPESDPEPAWHRIHRSRRPLGQLLMDQAVLAGVGNVYRAELLHLLRLDPFLRGNELDRRCFDDLWRQLVRLMPLGVATGRILVRPSDVARVVVRDAAPTRIRPSYAVYRRAGLLCPDCAATVRSAPEASRVLYWCPGCQTGGRTPRVAGEATPVMR